MTAATFSDEAVMHLHQKEESLILDQELIASVFPVHSQLSMYWTDSKL